MINESIHNHSLKKFANEDREMVVVLVGARNIEHDVHVTEVFIL
jgi:hypothetical protein